MERDDLDSMTDEPTIEPETDLERQKELARGGMDLLRDDGWTI